jgi:hypothetical protein
MYETPPSGWLISHFEMAKNLKQGIRLHSSTLGCDFWWAAMV